jgi:hypothetical protein
MLLWTVSSLWRVLLRSMDGSATRSFQRPLPPSTSLFSFLNPKNAPMIYDPFAHILRIFFGSATRLIFTPRSVSLYSRGAKVGAKQRYPRARFPIRPSIDRVKRYVPNVPLTLRLGYVWPMHEPRQYVGPCNASLDQRDDDWLSGTYTKASHSCV